MTTRRCNSTLATPFSAQATAKGLSGSFFGLSHWTLLIRKRRTTRVRCCPNSTIRQQPSKTSNRQSAFDRITPTRITIWPKCWIIWAADAKRGLTGCCICKVIDTANGRNMSAGGCRVSSRRREWRVVRPLRHDAVESAAGRSVSLASPMSTEVIRNSARGTTGNRVARR